MRRNRAAAWGWSTSGTGLLSCPVRAGAAGTVISKKSLKLTSHESLPLGSHKTANGAHYDSCSVLSEVKTYWRVSISCRPPTGLEGNQSKGRGRADYTHRISALKIITWDLTGVAKPQLTATQTGLNYYLKRSYKPKGFLPWFQGEMPPSPKLLSLNVALGRDQHARGEGAVQRPVCPSNAPTRPGCSLSPPSLASFCLKAVHWASLLAMIKGTSNHFRDRQRFVLTSLFFAARLPLPVPLQTSLRASDTASSVCYSAVRRT